MAKKQIKIIATFFLLALTILSSFNFVSARNDIIEFRQVYTVPQGSELNNFIKEMIIARTPKKSEYVAGEVFKIQGFQDINQFCSELVGQIRVLDSSGDVWATGSSGTIFEAGYMSAFFEITIDTESLFEDTYKVELQWLCNGQELGTDGRIGGVSDKEIDTFRVREPDPGEVPDEELCKISTCGVGTRLVNPNSANCFCEPTWTEGNGVCELGEIATSPDCEPGDVSDCEPGELYLEDSKLCYPANFLCEQYGGTKDCPEFDNQEEFDQYNISRILIFSSLALGLIFILIGGYTFFKNGK